MRKPSPHLLALIRRSVRPSGIARAVWLAVALLHVWLVLRRIGLGQLSNPMDFARAGLCLAGVGYASLKFWQVATIFDSAPRRAFAFGLVLLLGHWLVVVPGPDGDPLRQARRPLATIVVLAPAMAAVLLFVKQNLAARARPAALCRRPAPSAVALCQRSLLPFSILLHASALFRRPPPLCA